MPSVWKNVQERRRQTILLQNVCKVSDHTPKRNMVRQLEEEEETDDSTSDSTETLTL